MDKKIYSGSVCMGTCGKPTELFDSFGNQLMVGDLVSVYQKDYVKEISVCDPEYVVCPDGGGENGLPFIIGLKGCKRNTNYYFDGEEVAPTDEYDYIEDTYDSDENPSFKWIVKKIKDWKRTVDGEVWGSGNITTRLGNYQP